MFDLLQEAVGDSCQILTRASALFNSKRPQFLFTETGPTPSAGKLLDLEIFIDAVCNLFDILRMVFGQESA